jgi:outer membrane protein OmpA-like peptidoglycan-associated protein
VFDGTRIVRSSGDEAEKPFWISYADLMTSLMVLFLIVMLASLVALTRTVSDLQDTQSRSEILAGRYKTLKAQERKRQRLEGGRLAAIDKFWDKLERSSKGLGVRLDRDRQVIDFGSRARFASGSDALSGRDETLLRRFTPSLLGIANSALGRKVLDRVVVEGYADKRGSYLYNLNLSLDRSQRVLCALLAPGGGAPLSGAEKQQVRDLFLVGGFSFNSSRRSLAASRRVEIRLDFLPLDGKRGATAKASTAFGDCSLGR